MSIGLDPRPDFAHNALFINQERDTTETHKFFSIEILLAIHAIGLRDVDIGIREQRKGQTVFLGEFLMRSLIVSTDSQHLDAALLHQMVGIAEATRFGRTTWRVILWIKIQDNCTALEST